MSDAWKLVLGVCASIVTLAAAAGVIWWLIKPRIVAWVEDQILRPVRETHHQVTVNHHSSTEPTVLDRLDTLTTTANSHLAEIESVQENVSELTYVVIRHLQDQAD